MLRKDGRVLGGPPAAVGSGPAIRFRAISELLRSKGKVERWTCGADGTRVRIRRLEREMGAEDGVPFLDLLRGDIVTIGLGGPAGRSGEGERRDAIDERGRLEPHVAIDVGGFGH